MCTINGFESLFNRLKAKYPDALEEDLSDCIEFSLYNYKRLSNDPNVVIDDFANSWIKKACYESLDRIFKLGVVGGIKQYSENGYQFTLDGTEISIALASEVLPKVGFPR